MERCTRIAAVVLVVVGMASALAAQQSFAASPHEKPAGCHQHGKKSPARQPADYKCCVTGHDAALLRSAGSVHPVWHSGIAIVMAVPPVSEILALPASLAETPPNPSSRNVPLRV
jgi:hypothetical protein